MFVISRPHAYQLAAIGRLLWCPQVREDKLVQERILIAGTPCRRDFLFNPCFHLISTDVADAQEQATKKNVQHVTCENNPCKRPGILYVSRAGDG